MKVTIKSQVLDGFHLPFEAVFFRVYALNYFINQSDGKIVQPGGPFYYEWACTRSGADLVIPEIQLESTIDALNPAHPEGIRYFAGFYDTGGNPIIPFWPKPVFALDAHPNPTKWAAIHAYNSAGVEFDWTTEHANHYSKEEFDYLLDNPPPVPGRITVRPPLLFDGATLSIPRASAIQNGYLSRNDFILFSGESAVAVNSFNLRTGEVVLLKDDVLAALGYTPATVGGAAIGDYAVSAYGASGSKLTFVGAISSGSTTLTLTSSTHDFEVGQGIAIVAAGNIASIDVGSNLLVSSITAISGATITIADAALHTVTASIVKHDDTVAIQAATDDCSGAGGGTVLFDDLYGVYRINKGFSDINSILKIPFTPWFTGSVAGPPPPMIRFKGNGNNVASVLTPAVTLGPIIQTDLIGANSESAMLSSGQYAAGQSFGPCNQMTVSIEGLTFRSYDNPQISAIEMGVVWNCYIKDVCVDTGASGEGSSLFGGTLPGGSQPTHGTFGIRLPRINACTVVDTQNVVVCLYGIGFIGSELWHCDNTWAFRCGVGVQTHETASNYPITGNLLIVQCTTMMQWLGACPVDIHIEFEAESGGWWNTAAGRFLYDPGNVAQGIIRYLRVNAGGGAGGNTISVTGMNGVTLWSLHGLGVRLASDLTVSGNIGVQNVAASEEVMTTLVAADSLDLATLPVTFGADNSGGSGNRALIVPNATAFDPLAVPGLVMALRADSITGLSAGAGIPTWPDSGPNGYDGTQTSVPNQPIFQPAVVNGHAVARFAGGQCLQLPFPGSHSQPNTFYFVMNESVSNVGAWLDSYDVSSGRNLVQMSSAGLLYTLYAGSVVDGGTRIRGSFIILEVIFAGSGSQLSVNGTVLLTGDAGSQSFADGVMGCAYGASSFFTGDIAEFLMYGNVSSGNRTSIRASLGTYYGITTS